MLLGFIFMPAMQVITFDVAVMIRIIQDGMFRGDEEREKKVKKETQSHREGRDKKEEE